MVDRNVDQDAILRAVVRFDDEPMLGDDVSQDGDDELSHDDEDELPTCRFTSVVAHEARGCSRCCGDAESLGLTESRARTSAPNKS